MRRPAYRVFVSPWGNVFIRELADLLAAALVDLGREVTVVEDGLPDPAGRSVDLVVAPYDYFTLHRRFDEREMWRSVRASVAVTTEQPATVWLERSLPWLAASRLVLDLDTRAAAHLVGSGIPARRLRLGYHPSWDRWGGDRASPRPVDVAFLGAMTPRRGRWLAGAGSRLWDRACELRVFDVAGPRRPGDPGFVTGTDKWDRLATTELLVNVHRGDVAYFEWLRALDALANGCVVVTEPSLDIEPLVAGTHVVVAPVDLLADDVVGLLADRDRCRRIAGDAYDLLRSELRMTDLLAVHLDELESAAPHDRPSPVPRSGPDPPAPTPDPSEPRVADLARRGGFWVKRLLLAEEAERREVDEARSRLVHGTDRHDDVAETPAWAATRPEVSVVVIVVAGPATAPGPAPGGNFPDGTVPDGPAPDGSGVDGTAGDRSVPVAVAGTVAGVLAGGGPDLEVIVVDDAVSAGPWSWPDPNVALTVVRHGAGRGRAEAWRSGLARARGRWVLFVEAGVVPYPGAVGRLAAAAGEAGADLAYGIVVLGADPGAGGGDGGGSGVAGYQPWDVERLCAGDFLPLPVLVRASALAAAGGVDGSMTPFGGWVEWDLWLRLAASGSAGVAVPGYVARSTVPTAGREDFMVLDVSLPLAHLRARYPGLPWPASADGAAAGDGPVTPGTGATGPAPSEPAPSEPAPGDRGHLEALLDRLGAAGDDRRDLLLGLLADLHRG